MNRFLEWLFRPPLAVRVLQDENAWLRDENKRLSDLLTQAYESARIIPRQAEHQGPPAPSVPQRKTWGEKQAEKQEQYEQNFQAFQREESARLETVRQSNGSKMSGNSQIS